jgi:hypothetical protein
MKTCQHYIAAASGWLLNTPRGSARSSAGRALIFLSLNMGMTEGTSS